MIPQTQLLQVYHDVTSQKKTEPCLQFLLRHVSLTLHKLVLTLQISLDMGDNNLDIYVIDLDKEMTSQSYILT